VVSINARMVRRDWCGGVFLSFYFFLFFFSFLKFHAIFLFKNLNKIKIGLSFYLKKSLN